MDERQKIIDVVHTAKRSMDSTTDRNLRALCRAVELVGNSLLQTADSFKELYNIECLSEYIEGSIYGKVCGFNQLAILLSMFFDGVKLVTIDADKLKDKLKGESVDE